MVQEANWRRTFLQEGVSYIETMACWCAHSIGHGAIISQGENLKFYRGVVRWTRKF